MKEIFTRLITEVQNNRDLMLVSIIEMKGSAPRGVGAQMLVGNKGLLEGTIGGGSAENVAILKAQDMIKSKLSGFHNFELYSNATEDIGSVCGGDIKVHFQYVDHELSTWVELSKDVLDRIENRKSGTIIFSLSDKLPYIVDNELPCGIENNESYNIPITLGERVFIFGAGHCSRALVPILDSIGFRVTVIDNRKGMVVKESFPQAENLIIDDYTDLVNKFGITSKDYLVIMTAGHADDYSVEKQLIALDSVYIGCIGSKSKIKVVNDKLRNDGFSQELIDKVHTPIGLEIHSITPAEVAVSIAGEMILERYKDRLSTGAAIEKNFMI